MDDSPAFWHTRFQQQAEWTRSLRAHLLNLAGLPPRPRALEVGSGTGALLDELGPALNLTGLDIDLARLRFAATRHPAQLAGDAHHLPLAAAAFDLTICHFLLLWVADPAGTLAEMRRVTRPGGWVIAFAEPDYGGRLDYPEALATLGAHQTAALQAQGANPHLGRLLRALFARTGLQNVTCGVLGGEWRATDPAADSLEWQVITQDVRSRITPAELAKLQTAEQRAQQAGERLLFVPTFYALGQMPT